MKAAELIKPYFIENRFRILIGILCLILVDILQLLIPRIIKQAVDDLTGFQIEGRQLLIYAFYMVAIAVCIGAFRYVWRRCLLGTSRRETSFSPIFRACPPPISTASKPVI